MQAVLANEADAALNHPAPDQQPVVQASLVVQQAATLMEVGFLVSDGLGFGRPAKLVCPLRQPIEGGEEGAESARKQLGLSGFLPGAALL